MEVHLDRERIHSAFTLMARHLQARGRRGEILVAGGAVMALVFDIDRVTRDVDGLVLAEHGGVMEAAHAVAAELGLPRGWLNEGVSVYLSTEDDPGRVRSFDHRNLAVYSVSKEHLLALKARAARAQDLSDLRIIADELALDTSEEVVAIVDRFFPDDPLSERAMAAVEDLFGERG